MGTRWLVVCLVGLAACKTATFPMHDPLYPAANKPVEYTLTVDTDAYVQEIRLYERVAEVGPDGVIDAGTEVLLAELLPGTSSPFTVTYTAAAGYPANRVVFYRFEVDSRCVPDVSHAVSFAIRPYPVVVAGQPLPAPVYCQGSVWDRIDVVFIPDKDLQTPNPLDDEQAEFRLQCRKMITEAMWHDPTLARRTRSFNYFINPLMGNAVERPEQHEPPENHANLSSPEVLAILHKDDLKDWMSEGRRIISSELDSRWTFLHELGHRAFGLADEAYDENLPWKSYNLWSIESDAKAASSSLGKTDADVDPVYFGRKGTWYKLCHANCQMHAIANKKAATVFDSPCAHGIESELGKLMLLLRPLPSSYPWPHP